MSRLKDYKSIFYEKINPFIPLRIPPQYLGAKNGIGCA